MKSKVAIKAAADAEKLQITTKTKDYDKALKFAEDKKGVCGRADDEYKQTVKNLELMRELWVNMIPSNLPLSDVGRDRVHSQ